MTPDPLAAQDPTCSLPSLSPIPSAEPSNSVSPSPAPAIGEAFTHIECRPVVEDPMCPSCGHCGKLRDHVTRTLTDLPVVGHPTRLQVRLPRFVCEQDSCAVSVFRQRIDRVAAPKASTTRRTARWILHCLAVEKMSVSAVAKVLGVSWDVVNSLALSTVHNLVHRPARASGQGPSPRGGRA